MRSAVISHKKRSGPQNVWCKRNLVNLVLSPLSVRPIVSCYLCKQTKVMRSVSFFQVSGPNFQLRFEPTAADLELSNGSRLRGTSLNSSGANTLQVKLKSVT